MASFQPVSEVLLFQVVCNLLVCMTAFLVPAFPFLSHPANKFIVSVADYVFCV